MVDLSMTEAFLATPGEVVILDTAPSRLVDYAKRFVLGLAAISTMASASVNPLLAAMDAADTARLGSEGRAYVQRGADPSGEFGQMDRIIHDRLAGKAGTAQPVVLDVVGTQDLARLEFLARKASGTLARAVPGDPSTSVCSVVVGASNTGFLGLHGNASRLDWRGFAVSHEYAYCQSSAARIYQDAAHEIDPAKLLRDDRHVLAVRDEAFADVSALFSEARHQFRQGLERGMTPDQARPAAIAAAQDYLAVLAHSREAGTATRGEIPALTFAGEVLSNRADLFTLPEQEVLDISLNVVQQGMDLWLVDGEDLQVSSVARDALSHSKWVAGDAYRDYPAPNVSVTHDGLVTHYRQNHDPKHGDGTVASDANIFLSRRSLAEFRQTQSPSARRPKP